MLRQIDAKRLIDVALSTVLLLVTLPIILVLALASAVSFRAWPFFVQERVGRNSEVFRFLKVRTLPPTFDTYAAKSRLSDIELPRAMRLLRASHLDELPQLWLVMTGKMSLVGPRPEMAILHDHLAPEVAWERVSVRPGLTGLWQVSAHCDGLIYDRVEYDRLYVRYSRPLLDLWIMLKTLEKILLDRRIHLFEIPRWAIGEERNREAYDSQVVDLTRAANPTIPAKAVRAPLPAEHRAAVAVGAD